MAIIVVWLGGCSSIKPPNDRFDGGQTGGASPADTADGSSATTGLGGAAGASGAGGDAGLPGWPQGGGGTGGVFQIVAGTGHTCALLDGGRVRCWGLGKYGTLGYAKLGADIGDDETPASVGDVNVGGKVVQITAGDHHTCALLEGGSVRCWGWAFTGQLGYGNVDNIGGDEEPYTAGDVHVGGKVVQVAAGGTHTCALLDTGAVRCWGSNVNGELGYAHTKSIGDDELPDSAGDVNVGGRVARIAVAEGATCALLETGALRCWGNNDVGQLGYGNTENIGDDEAPARAGNVDVGGRVIDVALSPFAVCAVLEGGAVRCWGSSPNGQLGHGNTATIGDDEMPATAGDVDTGGKVVEVTLGWMHTCATLEGGTARCWGRNDYGQLGYANTKDIGDNELPSSTGDIDVGCSVTQMSAGASHTCALCIGGRVRCWGPNNAALGYGRPLGGPIGDDETTASAGDVPVY